METPKKLDSKVVMTGIIAVVLSVAAVLIMQPALAQTRALAADYLALSVQRQPTR